MWVKKQFFMSISFGSRRAFANLFRVSSGCLWSCERKRDGLRRPSLNFIFVAEVMVWLRASFRLQVFSHLQEDHGVRQVHQGRRVGFASSRTSRIDPCRECLSSSC